ncbi:putative membrane protein YeaQ/YmgE (transglycosylase-associated protein family) [Lutibacter oceani]|uniref:Putative membrane protein YeaQ/YmgE (Transglycosylase-associated protein family) n=1 Tax=Lutibacter oceani TaxID=1853311 RepID=A0A3D9RVV5_9FLAO|nr:GlsB/YeaQ/YmgE family stress response membrane protein [Lutibacter oceani]REE83598.1 putative membrane protein YeaQ/YmgE (transglycosylase-associated protein family) [Lutibacter oceani]
MLYSIIIGGIAGWLAGKLMKGGGFGLVKNIILGIIGGFVGGWLFNILGIYTFHGELGDLLEGVIGAVAILFVADLIKKNK